MRIMSAPISRFAARFPRAVAAAAGTTAARRNIYRRFPHISPRTWRSYSSEGSSTDPVALQMINYALGHARSLKTDDSYAQAHLVLEQCLSNHQYDTSGGTALLAMATLLSERGKFDDAIETLERIQELPHFPLGIRVLALEALVGLHLELGLDDTSSALADKCMQLFEETGAETNGEHASGVLHAGAKAVKGLVELVIGNFETVESYFQGSLDDRGSVGTGNAALSYGELLHVMRKFSTAKELYQKVITGLSESKDLSDPYAIGGCNMSLDEVSVAAYCALGQLEVHLGDFEDAQETLTSALKKAEECFGVVHTLGSHHPKVGVILTSIALMYKQKARLEHSSSILIQEGLYRRAIDLLKAPPMESESAKEKIDRRDIVALARGGYAEVLCIQQNRRSEGERMKKWAECAWRNPRLSLAEALEFSESSKVMVIDSRINRAL